MATHNPFASEKVKPQLFSPKGWRPTSPKEQLAVLQKLHPTLDGSHVLRLARDMVVPEGADGIFVVPKPSRLAELLGIEDGYGDGYGSLLQAACGQLAKQRRFHNYREGEPGPDRLYLRESTKAFLMHLEETQEGDFLVFAAQMGEKWAGYSPRNSIWEMEHGSEVPLDPWTVAHMLLTNPDRLSDSSHLVIDCPGAVYRLRPGDEPDGCLCFDFHGDGLVLDDGWLPYPSESCGSASAY